MTYKQKDWFYAFLVFMSNNHAMPHYFLNITENYLEKIPTSWGKAPVSFVITLDITNIKILEYLINTEKPIVIAKILLA